jgi:FkbM family methyltransferase
MPRYDVGPMGRPLLSRISRIDSIENHCFLPHPLTSDSVVVDLGANRGHFSHTIAGRYGLRCFGVEPNPALFQKLAADDRGVKFVNYAMSGSDQPVTLHISADITSSSIVSADVPQPEQDVVIAGRTLPGLLNECGVQHVDLLKVDIEGAEVPLFAATPDDLLRRIHQITIEFHDDAGLITREQSEQIRQRLRDLGFSGIKFSPNNTNWLFFRSGLAGPVTRAYMRYFVRNIRGACRRMGLRLG